MHARSIRESRSKVAFRFRVATLALSAAAAACGGGSSSSGGGGGGTPLAVLSDQALIRANGTDTVTVTVDGGSGAPWSVGTTLGTFDENGQRAIQKTSVPFSIVLRPCDSVADGACAGTAKVTVLDGGANQKSILVRFRQVERCANGVDDNGDGKIDCADPDCPAGSACNAYGKTCGTDQACSVCDGNGGAAELSEATCADGKDNDCDGKVDCADPDCLNDICNTGTYVGQNPVLGTCKAGGTCTCVAATGGETGAKCGNGLDDDCDGLVDCEDPNCQPVGNLPGQLCDALGHTCSVALQGVSTCSVCSGNGGAAETTETSCGDGKDNDCDGLVDCQDADCNVPQLVCDPYGKQCNSSLQCVCQGPEAAGETTCSDGQDNDCDGKIDCADPSCQVNGGLACNAFGSFCTTSGTCVCRGNGGVAQATETSCGDGFDNDCDGKVDCADPNCNTTAATCAPNGFKCTADTGSGSTCACSGNGGTAEATETSCGDGKDNDCDGLVDCADPDCGGQSCSTTGKLCGTDHLCSVCTGNGGAAQATEASCADGFDNDCDGLVDCADPNCATRACVGAPTADGLSTTTGVCTQSACKCTPVAENTDAACSNGKDDDCDGKIDCADPDCQPVANLPGKKCDALGHTCSPPALTGGVSVCGVVCSGNGGAVQTAETSCYDGADNDCNGYADCLDPSCANQPCSATGKKCDGATYSCVCPGGTTETDCSDHVDNDCDGKVDCADTDCSAIAAACGANGMQCSGTACKCSGNGATPETTETTCYDGIDNDCNGAVDCNDLGCRPTVAGTFGKACGDATKALYGWKCNITGSCVCPLGETVEVSCGDGKDNDCDGLVDCADPDCQPPPASGALGQPCGANGWTCGAGTCSVCSGNGGVAEAAEASCADGFDNDCDGSVDCADPGCLGQQCQPSSPNYRCTTVGTSTVCLDTTSNTTLTLAASPARIPADGAATTTVTATLKELVGGVLAPKSGATVQFAVTSGPGSISPATSPTNASGQATTTFTAGTAGGPSVVTATFNTGTQNVTGSTTIDQPALGSLKLASAQYEIMGARYSGFQETNQLTFQALDTMNVPYPPGLRVDFSHQAIGGSYLGATETCAGTPRVCTSSDVTDANGYVHVLLHSGTVATVLSVQATATAGGQTVPVSADKLAVVGAKASGAHIAIYCTPYNVPALADTDCISSRYAGQDSEVTCTVALADRFNNVLGVSTIATFLSEAGSAGPPASTPAYDPKKDPTSQANLGRASDYVAVTGYSLPKDVPHWIGEPSMTPTSGCAAVDRNPRDGLVTITVRVNGEEGFIDGSNGQPANGKYDPGEYFIDLGEPFVDENDNGTWDSGEPYVDVNSNGTWDPPNGVWDANAVIWAETRVLYSGLMQTAPIGGYQYLSRFYRDPLPPAPPPPAPTPTTTFAVGLGDATLKVLPTSDVLPVYLSDENFNVLSSRYAYALAKTGSVAPTWSGGDDPKVVDQLGMDFRLLYCDENAPASCATSCAYSPCIVVPSVTAFASGNWATVRIDPSGTVAGPASVILNGTLGAVTQSVTIDGTVTKP